MVTLPNDSTTTLTDYEPQPAETASDPFAVQPEAGRTECSDRVGDSFEDALAEAVGALGVGGAGV